MSEYSLIINILGRELEQPYIDYYKNNGIDTVFTSLCWGTASKSMLDFLGLEKNEKVMLQAIVSNDDAKKLMAGLVNRMGINLPGTGIAVTIPVGSIAGSASMMYLTNGNENEHKEMGKQMSEMLYSLITVICEKGCSDMVMDAARAAGAGGGTVVHGKGTANEFTAKFFGVSIATEKEIIYIVSKKCDKANIMKSIIEKAGPTTEARAAAFSLPVDEVVGLCSVME